MNIGRKGWIYACTACIVPTSACGGEILLGSNDRYPSDSGSEEAGTGIVLVVDGAPQGGSGSLGGSDGDSSPREAMTAPTWSSIWSNDLNQKTCSFSSACHVQWTTVSGAYNYLQSQGCLPDMGCIAGFGAPGNMPLFGVALSSTAVADIEAWIAAGSQDN